MHYRFWELLAAMMQLISNIKRVISSLLGPER